MKILYFTDDFSQENIVYAQTHGLTMRNVEAYYEGDSLEYADAVCGVVPDAYANKYPQHELVEVVAVDAKKLKLDELKTLLAELAEKGIEAPKGASKAELLALLELSGDENGD